MPELPTLDAHAHIDPIWSPEELGHIGAVLAMTLSMDEAEKIAGRDGLLFLGPFSNGTPFDLPHPGAA